MTGKLVIDSSVVVKWLNHTNEERLNQADQIMRDVEAGRAELLTSELAKFEVGNVLLLSKKLTPAEMKISLATLYTLPLKFLPHTEKLFAETFTIADKTKTTFYDAAFMALARQKRAILVTDNPKHQRGTKDIRVIPLEKYK
jgi:predicted nucleic acid-binding protein